MQRAEKTRPRRPCPGCSQSLSRRAAAPGLAIVLCCSLAACSAPTQILATDAPVAHPRLALPASALGCELALQQQLVVQPPGQPEQTLQALLQVDAQTVRLALFHMGQRMGVLVWDGRHLQTELSRWWPVQLPPDQVLGDMQLALWPAGAIAQALPSPWGLEETAQARRLVYRGQARVEIRPAGYDAMEIVYADGAWRLHIASPGGMRPCTAAGDGA